MPPYYASFLTDAMNIKMNIDNKMGENRWKGGCWF